MFQKRFLFKILIGLTILSLSACEKKSESQNESRFVGESQSDDTDGEKVETYYEEDNAIGTNDALLNADESKESGTIEGETNDFVSDNSGINVSNVLSDGRIWAVENYGDTKDVVLMDIYGNVYSRTSADLYPGYLVCGIDSETVAFKYDDEISIYNTRTNQNITESIVGDHDYINEIFWVEAGPIFSVKKKVETFSEEYLQYKLVDANMKQVFEISLDEETLNTYGIFKNYSIRTDRYVYIYQLTDDVYYIPHIGDGFNGKSGFNSLIIDISNNMITPVEFPGKSGSITISSGDGVTAVYANMQGSCLIDNNTGEHIALDESDRYSPIGNISEGKFSAAGSMGQRWAIFDIQGRLLIDLNNYGHVVKEAYEFHNNACLIEFIDNYVTFIDSDGVFLFEPIKGEVRLYDKEHDMAIIDDVENDKVFILDTKASCIL